LDPPVPLSPSGAEPVRQPTRVRPGEDHVALLLPLESHSFSRHAAAVRDGFLAAARTHADGPLVRVHPTADDAEQVVERYVTAINEGARAVVGPLIRNSVSAVATSAAVVVPTLALNEPDASVIP